MRVGEGQIIKRNGLLWYDNEAWQEDRAELERLRDEVEKLEKRIRYHSELQLQDNNNEWDYVTTIGDAMEGGPMRLDQGVYRVHPINWDEVQG